MVLDSGAARRRIVRFIESVITPQRLLTLHDLDVGVYRPSEICSVATARKADYEPVQPGYHFGPTWATAWFRMTGELSMEFDPWQLVAVIDTNTEACVWNGNVPYHGLSEFHRVVPIAPDMVTNGRVELFVEAAANQLWGTDRFNARYTEEPIGLLREARLAQRVPEIEQLYHDLHFGMGLYDSLPPESPRAKKLLFAMNDAINALDANNLAATAIDARQRLESVMSARASDSTTTCHAIGHAHLDVAWLWPLRETRRKAYRTFATALRNMERYPDFRFQQGQAQLYAYIEQDHPALFEQVRQRVRSGEWEASGGLWVEPDCNMVSGESLVRQLLHGTRYFESRFDAEQTYAWLPDTFGYCAALPQIFYQAGIRTVFTQKMSWNEVNRFPHHTFWWVGLDGTRIIAHFLTSDTYNSDCSPRQLRESERAFTQGDRCNDWLYAFGWGDGGGGPTDEMIESLRRAADCEELPRVRMAHAAEIVDILHRRANHLPAWNGELYLETHRGTLTTQAANKRDNRRAELQLRDVELLCALLPESIEDYPADMLDATWKTVLLNQFHDILPGSSIHQVFEDSARDYATVFANLHELRSAALQSWARAADTSAARAPLVAVNTLGWQRTDVVALPQDVATGDSIDAGATQVGVEIDGGESRLALLNDVAGVGHTVFDLAELPRAESDAVVSVADRALENQWVRVEVDDVGRVVSLVDKRIDRQVLASGAVGNDLALYEDRPFVNDAWDIDLSYLEKRRRLPNEANLSVIERGPLRGAIRVERELSKHIRLVQHIRLSCTSARIDFETWIDWQPDHELLRVLFPVAVRSMAALYHAQFGVHERPTHFNTTWDQAKYECCGHHWCDISEPDYGVALLSDSKYGYSCHENTLGLSLLRSPRHPDPLADRGEHRFTYSILPHVGNLASSDVLVQGYQLNVPMLLCPTTPHAGPRGPRYSAIQCDRPNMLIDTVKRAETDRRLIVRLHEAFGQRGPTTLAWEQSRGEARAVDLHEAEGERCLFKLDSTEAGQARWRHRPFGLYTLAIGDR